MKENESISEKAKTGREICDSIMEFYKGLGATRLDGKLHISLEEFKQRELEEWVRVSVAQQEIDKHGKNNEALAKVCADLSEKVATLERERGELKQKLGSHAQKLVALIPSEDKILRYDEETKESWLVVTADPEQWRGFSDRLDKWLLELRELLKE